MTMLINGSKYKLFDIKHIIKDNLIIKNPIPITEQYKLERLYLVIKYTTQFLEENEIDYCAESGTLLGCVRHKGIIPWDNDIDIMIFRDGYFKMKTLINKYNNNHFSILHMTPGFRLFYDNECYGELFVYDFDEKINLYRMAYPIINHYGFNKSTFLTSKLYYPHQKYKKNSLFPTKKKKFEDFYIRVPNNILYVLKNTYNGNLLECIYIHEKKIQYESIKLNNYKFVATIEKLVCNRILIFIYIILHWSINKFAIHIL
jgi:hypothetical protein